MTLRHAIPLLLPAAGWVAGLAAARSDAVSWTWLGALAVAAMLLVAVRRWRLFAVLLLAGVIWGGAALLLDAWRVAYDASWTAATVEISATVAGVTETPAYRRIRLTDVGRSDGESLHGLVDIYLFGRQPLPLAGQKVDLSAKLRPPQNHRNPGAFDYVDYCFDRHIVLTGSLRGSLRIVDPGTSWLERMRARIRHAVAGLPPGQSGVLQALLLGERGGIPVSQYEAFAATGAAHLLAISGLHIGMVAAWGFAITWWLLTRREAWIVAVPVRKVALSIGMLTAIAYATLAGWPLPTQRAVLMLVAAVAAWWLRARYAPLNILLAALMLILLIDPAAVVSVSLWLSFVAAAALVTFAAGREGTDPGWRGWLTGLFWVSLVAGLATLPLIAAVFGRLPAWNLPANLLLVPLYGGLILPLSLLGALSAMLGLDGAASTLLHLAGTVVGWGNAVMQQLHHWPAGNLWLPAVPTWAGLFYGAGVLLALWLWQRQGAGVAMAAFAAVLAAWLLVVVPERPPAVTTFTAWDVGQGAASSLVLPDGTTLLIDAPGRARSRFNGGTTMAAGLRTQGITHADVLILSHAQSDHAGGAARLFDQLRAVHELWLADVPANRAYLPMLGLIRRIGAAGGTVRWLAAGDRLQVGDMRVNILWPPRGFAPENDNNTSLVASVTLPGGQRLLLPGDMEQPVEHALLNRGLGRHQVLLVPHHGSRTSSSAALLDRLQPQLAVAQTGRHNRYRFPADAVLRRYRQRQIPFYNTAGGNVSLLLPGHGGVSVRRYHPPQAGKRNAALQWVRVSL